MLVEGHLLMLPIPEHRDTATGSSSKWLFCFLRDSRTPSVIKSLHGLRGRKHRLTLTPVASRPNFQRGIGQHVRDSGEDSTGMDESLASSSARRGIKCASGRG